MISLNAYHRGKLDEIYFVLWRGRCNHLKLIRNLAILDIDLDWINLVPPEEAYSDTPIQPLNMLLNELGNQKLRATPQYDLVGKYGNDLIPGIKSDSEREILSVKEAIKEFKRVGFGKFAKDLVKHLKYKDGYFLIDQITNLLIKVGINVNNFRERAIDHITKYLSNDNPAGINKRRSQEFLAFNYEFDLLSKILGHDKIELNHDIVIKINDPEVFKCVKLNFNVIDYDPQEPLLSYLRDNLHNAKPDQVKKINDYYIGYYGTVIPGSNFDNQRGFITVDISIKLISNI